MRRLALLGTLLALACSLLLAPGGNAAAGPGTVADKAKSQATALVAARRVPTRFALGASGFGPRIVGGDIPAASGSTAWRALGCTKAAGLDKSKYEAEVNIPGL